MDKRTSRVVSCISRICIRTCTIDLIPRNRLLAIGESRRRRRIEVASTACHMGESSSTPIPYSSTSEVHFFWCILNRDCDSPFTLTNFTLDFLEKHWAKEIDFVICKLSALRVEKKAAPIFIGRATLCLDVTRCAGTGDSARCVPSASGFISEMEINNLWELWCRHDNDRELPRTPDEIYELNRAMARRMNEVFTSRGIPVVPTLGERSSPLLMLRPSLKE